LRWLAIRFLVHANDDTRTPALLRRHNRLHPDRNSTRRARLGTRTRRHIQSLPAISADAGSLHSPSPRSRFGKTRFDQNAVIATAFLTTRSPNRSYTKLE